MASEFQLKQYTITLLFTEALVALLARTLFVTFRFWRNRASWRLGLVIAMGEVFAVLQLSLFAVETGYDITVRLLLIKLQQSR